MGQENCHCAGMCGPQAPEEERRHQVTVEPEPPRSQGQSQDYAAPRHGDANGSSHHDVRSGETPRDTYSRGQDNGWDHDGGYLPPPPPEPVGFAPAPVGGGGGGRGVTIEAILDNLDHEEEKAYGAAFDSFSGGAASVELSNDGMREFISRNNALSMEDVEMAMLMTIGEDIEMGINRDKFITLIRKTAIKDEEVLNQYQCLVTGDAELTSPECRSGLLAFATSKLGMNFSEERWEAVLDSVMKSAGITISMENWLEFCGVLARICRLVRHLNM